MSIIHFSQSSFFSPARKSSPRSRYLLLPPSCTSFRLRFQIVVPRCQSPEDNLLPHSHLQYMYIYRSLKEKSNNRWLSIRSLTITSSFFPVQYDSKPRHSLSVEITGFPRAWHRLLRHRPGLLVSWPIDASTSVVEGTWIQIIPSLLLAKRDGHNPWWVSTKKKKKRKGRRNPPPFPNTWTREDGPSTDRSRATGTEFSSVRNASLRLCPAFYDAIFRPALHEIPSKSAGTLSQIVVVNCLRILRLEGGHLLDRALFRFLLLHEADAPGLVPHHYVHHESENQDSASGTWTIRAIYYRLIDWEIIIIIILIKIYIYI